MRLPLDRRTLLCGAAATVLLGAALIPIAVTQAGTLGRVDVYDRSAAAALPIHRHLGRRYVEGQPGNEYAVRIRNCSGQRLLAVLSVDGVNAITGETASPDQAGYVIEPGGYVTVQGWRKDLDRTAAFYFSDPQDSYASRTGRPNDLGVIGVALFRERPVERPAWFSDERLSAAPPMQEQGRSKAAGAVADSQAARAPAAANAAPSLGTGHGRGEYSPAQRVEFERANTTPDEVVAIRYERRETLVALGVLPATRDRPRHTDPFPGALSFVPDP
jgi:hypothetical protein